jgi:hypothetical protein
MNDLLNWMEKCEHSALLNRTEAEAFAANMNARFGKRFAYTNYSIEKAIFSGRAIRVTIRKQLGLDVAIPVNDAARILARIAQTRTLELDTLAFAAELGHTIELTSDAELGKLHDAIALLTLS